MNSRKQKGSVLVFALIVLFIGITAAIGVASTAVISRKNAINTASSTQAFQAADSGVEVFTEKFNRSSEGTLDDLGLPCSGGVITGDVGGSGKTYSVTAFNTGETSPIADCDTTSLENLDRIKSVGSYKGTYRAVLVTVRKSCLKADSNTVGYWKMNETSGSLVEDATGSNDGVATGTTVISGILGRARFLNGTGDYISMNSAPTTNVANWTLESWIRPDNLTQQNGIIVYNGNGSGGYGFGIGNGSGGEGAKLVGLFDGVGWIDSGYTFSEVHKWYHVVMTRDGSTTRFYVYGQQTSGTSTATPKAVANKFSIGMEYDSSNSPTRFFAGAVDEVRISNIARDANYISDNYHCMKLN